MNRFFNIAGPVNPRNHYCLPPLQRLDLDQVLRLIEQQQYFVLHAPRQTGKTSSLLALMEHLNRQGRTRCVYINVEIAQPARENVAAAMQAILGELGYECCFRMKEGRDRGAVIDAALLLIQAFLQRIVNGGGRIEREYGLGRMRTDLLVIWPFPGGVQKVVIELKLLHKGLARTLDQGLPQTLEYMDRCGAEEGHLVAFDHTPGKTWEDKLFRRVETVGGKAVTVWGM